ncbi:MAG: YbhB/YbcL family Raf kinase inhibitor-like protein [Planctomycetes bacterium]|nr:YbhB/YbcL family Raf kinase inhibitor-like protein [Planctomycetota bacterium]
MKLQCPVLGEDAALPIRFTKDGDNVSPPVNWSDAPAKTQEWALCFESITPQTKPPFVQWLIYGIPKDWRKLPEGFRHKSDPEAPEEAVHGRNDIGNIGYDGPLGTADKPVRCRVELFALDAPLDAPPGLTKEELLTKARGHVLESAELIATYVRRRTNRKGRRGWGRPSA